MFAVKTKHLSGRIRERPVPEVCLVVILDAQVASRYLNDATFGAFFERPNLGGGLKMFADKCLTSSNMNNNIQIEEYSSDHFEQLFDALEQVNPQLNSRFKTHRKIMIMNRRRAIIVGDCAICQLLVRQLPQDLKTQLQSESRCILQVFPDVPNCLCLEDKHFADAVDEAILDFEKISRTHKHLLSGIACK